MSHQPHLVDVASLRPSFHDSCVPSSLDGRPLYPRVFRGGRERHGWSGAAALLAAVVALGATDPPTTVELPARAGIAVTKHTAAGATVRWRAATVAIAIDRRLSDLTPEPLQTVSAAVAIWQGVDPGLPGLVVGATDSPAIGFSENSVNQNVVTLAPAGFANPAGALAMTILTFSSDTGTILDADIVIDARSHVMSEVEEGSPSDAYDLQSVLSHELGHVLGLGEDTSDDAATMYYRQRSGDTSKRTLTDADRQAMAALYRPEAPTVAPHHASCGVGTPGGTTPRPLSVAILLIAPLVLSRRWRVRGAVVVALGLAATTALSRPAEAAEGAFFVSQAVSRWDGGLITTDIELTSRGAAGVSRKVIVLGGSVGAITQSIDGALVPELGATVTLAAGARADRGRHVPSDFIVARD